MARALVQNRSFFSSTLAGLANNQFATGGLAVLAGGAGLALARTISRITWDGIVRRVVVRAEFDSRDDSYRWLVAWLSQHPHYATTKRFSVLTSMRRIGASSIDSDGGKTQKQLDVMLVPSGTSLMRHRGNWIIVDRNKEDEEKSSGRERETLTIHIIGGHKQTLLNIITEARDSFLERERARTAVYFIDEYGSWTRVSSKPARPATQVSNFRAE